MAKHPLSKREDQHQLTRRALIKWSVAAGAALGVSRSKVFEILEGTAGRETAHAAADNAFTRSIHLVAGNGGLANFTQNFPLPDIAMANNGNFSYHAPGQATLLAGIEGGRKLAQGPATPWKELPAARQFTAFLCGANETHTNAPGSTTGLNGSNIFSVASALQAANPSVIPLVTIGDTAVGQAPGGATPANVNNADGIVGLFNSAASRAGGLLENTSDAALYKAHYDSLIQLNRAANRSTTRGAYITAQGAAKFLGTNLSSRLAVTQADLDRYKVNGGTPNNIATIARAFIVAVKAFKMGLTNSIVLPALRNDPHGFFDGGQSATVPGQLCDMFNGLMKDLIETVDDNTLKSLANDTVITIHGDTYKDPRNRGGWPDGTPGNTNIVYVWSSGHLKSGWFGNVGADGAVQGFDANGAPVAYRGGDTATLAMASIAYAIAKRDERAIGAFANGITISGKLGNPKEI